jgi:translation initiation factor 3 subunit L
MHVLLGDYYLAVKTLDPIQIHSKAKYTQVSSAYVAIHYYLGFSFLMLRRYQDAIDILSGILLYMGRAKKVQASQYDQAKYDNMYALLAILVTLLPSPIDEHVQNTLHTEHSDKVIASQRDMEQLFSYSCPKFVSPVPPTFDEEEIFVHSNAPLPLQRKVFMKEIDQQTALPTILSYLRLYSSIGLDKFVTLLDRDKKMNTLILRTHLLCLAHKSFQKHLTPGNNLSEGVRESATYQQFWMEADMVHIVDKPTEKKYGEIFLNNTNQIISALHEVKKQKQRV